MYFDGLAILVFLLLVGRYLQQQGHIVACAENGRQAIAVLEAEPVDVVLCDLRMPDLILAAKEGYTFSDATTGENLITSGPALKGSHGHLPSEPALRGVLVAWGARIRPGATTDAIPPSAETTVACAGASRAISTISGTKATRISTTTIATLSICRARSPT